jgi:hypothetical protein
MKLVHLALSGLTIAMGLLVAGNSFSAANDFPIGAGIINIPVNLMTDPNKPDSSRYNRARSNNVTVKYPSQNVDTTPPTNLRYDQLPGCPGDPIRVAASPAWPKEPHCGDIGQKLTSSQITTYYKGCDPNSSTCAGTMGDPIANTFPTMRDANCPAQCTVTQAVTTGAGGAITDVKPAICPDGYAQVASYNTQKEITFVNTPQVLQPSPIPTVAEYDTMRAKPNVSCNINLVHFNTVCETSVGSGPAKTSHKTSNGVAIGALGVITEGGQTGVGKYYYITADTTPYQNFITTCHTALGGGWTLSCAASGADGSSCSISPDITFSNQYTLSWGFMECTQNSGYAYTGNMAPASLVCARVQKQWDTKN